MKIEKTVVGLDGSATELKVTYSGQDKDKIHGKVVDEFLEVYVRLGRLPTTNSITYQGHGTAVVVANIGYIPSQAKEFTPERLLAQAYKDVEKSNDYEYWFPKLQEEIEGFIKSQTKKGKPYSMRGDLNKAVFVATYLYYLATVPLSLANRHKAICEKLNMTSGNFTKVLSRVSVPLSDVSKHAKKKNLNIFTSETKMTVKDKDVFLMSNSLQNLKGGYLSGYGQTIIEDYMQKYWEDKGLPNYRPGLNPECMNALLDTRYADMFEKSKK